MRTASKMLSIIVCLYLATGIPGVVAALTESGVRRLAAFAYVGCLVLATAGVAAAFTARPKAFRVLCLWAIGLPCLVYATQDQLVQFPTFLNVPVSFGSQYSSGEFTKFGVDIIPSVLFVVLWVVSKSVIRAQEPTTASSPGR